MDAMVLIAAAVVLVLFRLHAFDLPLETDECNYAYIGARLLEGDSLYTDVWDHQPPGVFALFAGVIAVFGDSPDVFRWLATAASLVTLVCLYGCGLRIGGRCCAVCAAALFAIVSSDPGTGGEGCNREIFMNALVALAWLMVLWRHRTSRRCLFAAGLMLGLASVIKTVVAVHWLFLAIAIVLEQVRFRAGSDCTGYKPVPHKRDTGRVSVLHKKNSPDKTSRPIFDQTPEPQALACADTQVSWVQRALSSVLLFGLGPAIIWFAVFAYFATTGRSSEFVDAVFGFNVGYSDGGDGGFFRRFILFFAPPRHPFVFGSAIALWVFAATSTIWLFVRTLKGDRFVAIIFAWLFGAYVAACIPARFWPHYYYLLIPPACLAVAWASSRAVRFCQSGRSSLWVLRVAGIPIVVIAAVLLTEYREYVRQPLFGITVKRYNSRDFWGRAQGENVRRVTDPGDEIFVYGNDASIYYYADRRSASRYTMITGIGAGMIGAKDRRRIMMNELRADPPRVIVVLFDEPPFPEWKAFLDDQYSEPVGWDLHDKTREPIMFVMARKDQPIEQIDWDWDRSSVGGWQLGDESR